jgi:Cu/Ag efflux pump CusA
MVAAAHRLRDGAADVHGEAADPDRRQAARSPGSRREAGAQRSSRSGHARAPDIAIAFLPVFTLVDQEGRLFKPLAFTKNLSMAVAAILAITLDPAMRMIFTRMDHFTFRPRFLSWLANRIVVGKSILRTFSEVQTVFGKAGRAETSTDPAPFSMMETTVVLKPEPEWHEVPRWYSSWAPDWLKSRLRAIWRDRITRAELVAEMDRALRIPGTRSVFAERTADGYFLDFELKREALARYGLTVDDANAVVMSAVGGDVVTTTIEGRQRYGVQLRYPRELRDTARHLPSRAEEPAS